MEHKDVNRLREDLAAGKVTPDDVAVIANKYLEDNRLEQAYPVVSLLTESPQASNHTIMTAGLLALALSIKNEAAGFFEKVVEADPGHFDANYNLILLDLDFGRTAVAEQRLNRLIEANPENASLYSDMAVLYANKSDYKNAMEYWQKALSLDPNLSLARDNALEICLEKNMVTEGKHLLRLNASTPGVTSQSVKEIEGWAERFQQRSQSITVNTAQATSEEKKPESIRGKKIVIFASIDTFIKDIAEYLSANNELKMFTSGTVEDIRRLMDWADLAWFEWCDNFIVEATKLPKTCRIVCRLHSYEVFGDMPGHVDWSKVDKLIFVNESVKDIFEKQYKVPTPAVVVHNAVDIDRYSLPTTKTYGKKIASVGYINYKKNPSLLLYCFKKIHEYDPEYSLHIAGEHQDARIQLYFDHFLKENPLPVYFDGWVNDMPGWYSDKDYVISTSLFESFHYSIAEGMACGLMPLIHNWYGAANLYPGEFLFNDPDKCLNLVKRLEELDRAELARSNRDFIAQRYNLSDKLSTIDRQLGALMMSEIEERQLELQE